MDLPDVSRLAINDSGLAARAQAAGPEVPEDIAESKDRYMQKLATYARSIPYPIEDNTKMQKMLDFILLRIAQCIEAKDYDPGLLQWDSMLSYWRMLKYPMPKEKRIALAKLFFHVCTTPGMPMHIVATCSDTFVALTRSKNKVSIEDMRLPWKPIYNILSKDLFLTKRQFEISQTSWYMGYMAENSRKFFHPAAIDEMLATFVPLINGTSLNTILASQYYMLNFLPISHPQSYLPTLFRVWFSLNSYMYDERMLHFLSRLAEMHIDPSVSNPKKLETIPDDALSKGEERPNWKKDDLEENGSWSGLFKDVGIFTDDQWNHLMCKCLASMEIPLKDAGSLTTGPSADKQAGFELGRLPKPVWRIPCLAKIIVYSMAQDGMPTAPSYAPTPFTPFTPGNMTPMTPGTPQPGSGGNLGDYLSHRLSTKGMPRIKTYLAGSKALDSLVKLIASTEGFFHPTNSGAWTADLSAFIKFIVFEFNKRWHEEQSPDCKTPKHRRLTPLMKRELVKSLRTVALLAMFSSDSTTVSNIQSCLKSMSVMEPDLILYPILERAFPALEALVETQRTLAVIKALGAVAPALVCRDVYYPGAKHLIPILELLLPGIDLNDPSKTLCTTAFIVEISQYIMIGELTNIQRDASTDKLLRSNNGRSTPGTPRGKKFVPAFKLDGLGFFEGTDSVDDVARLNDEDEDTMLRDSTASFADWVAGFIRRVIILLENLPEEGATGVPTGGASESQIIDAVTGACSQICVHLSEPLYDLVLNMIFDYASTTVRANAVRAIHQLVECVANANPRKTLEKFFPFCEANIITELENGASSTRTTSDSSPLPSDATLHWNLAILRGSMYNDGKATLKYKSHLIALLRRLREKTFSKRGYTWTGRLLSSTLLTLTHTYPTENKFVNPDEWASEEFQQNHHKYWGKLYKPEDVKISWHTPTDAEISFALEIFKELVEPTLISLEKLLGEGVVRDSVWRNDFCRHLNFVRDAFSGIPTLVKEYVSPEEVKAWHPSSDIINEVEEMVGHLEPLNSGFALTDPADGRWQYITSLRRRFGDFLHRASVSLQTQGEQNTVDAVIMLVRSIRTYTLEYGDSRDSYFLQRDQYNSERGVTRQYANQKVWPRAVFVRKARFYHSARLRWNSIERKRTALEEQLVDDLVEWSIWHYASVRQTSQSLLESLCSTYDGMRRRCLPKLYKALEPGTDDDRMKGALWTLNCTVFSKYAVGEPTLATEFVKHLFVCQHNEKPSIQDCVSSMSDNCLSSFVEPNFVIYSIDHPSTALALDALKNLLPFRVEDQQLTLRCTDQRKERINLMNEALDRTTGNLLAIAQSSKTHWRYLIVAIRCLRTLIRRDRTTSPEHLQCMIEKCYDSHPTLRYYSQRAVMKHSRFVKLKSTARGPVDLVMEQSRNPLRRHKEIKQPSHAYTKAFLHDYRASLNLAAAKHEQPLLCEKPSSGWLAWAKTADVFELPDQSKPTFLPWADDCRQGIEVYRKLVTDEGFWKKLAKHYSSENHADVITQDHVSCVKSIFQLLDNEPLHALKPTMEELLGNKDKNKQRGGAEFLAGVLSGSKHWPLEAQKSLWDWFAPWMKKIFKENITKDTLLVWTSFLENMFFHKDPRRVQPLVDWVVSEFQTADMNGESTFAGVKVLCMFRAFYEDMEWKAAAWMDEAVLRVWPELTGEHDDVRAYIAELLAFSAKAKWQPVPSEPSAEVFVRECRTTAADFDIMGISGGYHEGRVMELVKKFGVWRAERQPGVRAFQSTYDRVGVAVCKWLYQTVHDVQAISTFQYILPLMPELFRFAEVPDNDELSLRAEMLLVRMCGVSPPTSMANDLLDAIFAGIHKSTSWKVRLKALPLLQVFYFRQMPLITDLKIIEILEVVCQCLDDDVVEVREMAATTLSGILRLSPRRSVITLKDRFVRLINHRQLPDRRSPAYTSALRQRHAAILGICALVDSFPYTVERWMPELLTGVLAEHTYDPVPVSTAVRRCASTFKKTHQDTWHEDAKRFSDDQLAALSTLLTGSSYYA